MAESGSSCHSRGIFYEQRMQVLSTLSVVEGSLLMEQHPRIDTN